MNNKRSSASQVAGSTAKTGSPHLCSLKNRIIICAATLAAVLYCFFFVLGGTFNSVKRAELKKTMGHQKLHHGLVKSTQLNPNAAYSAATRMERHAIMQAANNPAR